MCNACEQLSKELEEERADSAHWRKRAKRMREVLTSLKTVLEGVVMRGKVGKPERFPSRYNAIMRCREILAEWEKEP